MCEALPKISEDALLSMLPDLTPATLTGVPDERTTTRTLSPVLPQSFQIEHLLPQDVSFEEDIGEHQDLTPQMSLHSDKPDGEEEMGVDKCNEKPEDPQESQANDPHAVGGEEDSKEDDEEWAHSVCSTMIDFSKPLDTAALGPVREPPRQRKKLGRLR